MAVLRFVPKSDWEVLKNYLNDKGVILIPEENTKGIEKLKQYELDDYEDVWYDFGGEADIWVDIASHEDHYVIKKLCEAAEEEDED